ncbi:MAG TPA: hypothetical protein VGE07_12240, partial [Herpetosiphonaceae bacterium]
MKGLRPKQAAGGCVLGLLAFLGSRLLLRRLKPMDTPTAAIPLPPPPEDDQLASDAWTRELAGHGAALRAALAPAEARAHAEAIRALVLAELGRFGELGTGDWGLGTGDRELAESSVELDAAAEPIDAAPADDGAIGLRAAAEPIDPALAEAAQPPAAEDGAMGSVA